jgi:hypothetical protein
MKMKPTKANAGSTPVVPKFGLERHKQVVAESWKSERHAPRPGTARQSGKRKR